MNFSGYWLNKNENTLSQITFGIAEDEQYAPKDKERDIKNFNNSRNATTSIFRNADLKCLNNISKDSISIEDKFKSNYICFTLI